MMSAPVEMNTQNSEIFEAAQALLSLQGSFSDDWHGSNKREDVVERSKLFLNCFIASDVPVVSNNNPVESTASMSTANYPIISTPIVKNRDIVETECIPHESILSGSFKNCNKRYFKNSESHITKYATHKLSQLGATKETVVKNMIKGNTSGTIEIKTREMGTQTEEHYFNPVVELMETTIKNLCERIQLLESEKLNEIEAPPANSEFVSSDDEVKTENDKQNKRNSQNNDFDMSLNEDTKIGYDLNQYNPKFSSKIRYTESRKNSKQDNDNGQYEKTMFMNHNNTYPNSSDLVPIGHGHATVSGRLLKHINWNSYTSATRKLLTAVFSRRILATHSLTGKPSPAFPNKPAKKKLDSDLVNDIVQTVVERCSVPENVVRTSITTKCADESKMFRTRQTNKKRRTTKNDRENVPPTTSESESESC